MTAVRIVGAVVTLPLLFFIPGWVVFRSRLFRSADLSWTGKLLVPVVLSASLASLVALLLAEWGHLSIWLLDLVLAAVALAVRLALGSTGRSLRMPGPRRWELLALLALVVLSAVLFFRPGEYVVGDGDPGYYFNNGANIAKTGSVAVYDESIPGMGEFELRASYANGVQQFTPLHLRSRSTGKVMPLLYHLLPVWIGLFIMMFGKTGGLFLLPVFATLSLFAVFALGRRYSGVGGSLLGALLLGLFFPQVWFSRYPVSETFAQFFIISSLLFFLHMRESEDASLGIASALALVASACARPEVLLVIAPMAALVLFDMLARRYRAAEVVFVNTLLAGMVYVWFYVKFAVQDYFFIHTMPILRLTRTRSSMNAVMFAALLLIGMGFIFFNLPWLRRLFGRLGDRIRRAAGRRAGSLVTGFKVFLAVLLLCTFLYYYYVAPRFANNANDPHRFFYNMCIFFGGIGFFLFAAAFCLLVLESRPATAFLFSSLVFLYTVAFSETRVTSGYLPWVTRRYISVVVPLIFIGAGYAAAFLWKKNPGFKVAVAGLSIGFMALFCYFLAPVVGNVEYRGIDKQLSELAKKADGDVVIFTDAFLGDVLGIPLRYQYGVDARMSRWLGDAEGLAEMVRKYNAEGRRVIIEGSGTGIPEFDPRIPELLRLREAFSEEISFPRLRITYKSRPREFGVQEFDLDFFYLEPVEQAGAR